MDASSSPLPNAPRETEYTVESGDTLGSIARRFGTTVETLADRNGISDPNRIRVGERLWIPLEPGHTPLPEGSCTPYCATHSGRPSATCGSNSRLARDKSV